MPFEHDDQGLRIIGYNQPIRFYDPTRTLRAEIYLQPDNTLNVGGLTAGGSGSTSAGGTHGLGDLAIHTGTLANAQGPQFALLDGTRPLTANWDAGDFRITAKTLASDVATGTAPLVVASTTAVSNLNADLLDGKEYADISGEIDGDVSAHAGDADAHHRWPLADSDIPDTHTHTDGSIPLAALAELVAAVVYAEPVTPKAGQVWVIETA